LFNPRTPRQIERIQEKLSDMQKIITAKDTVKMKEFLEDVRKKIE
jgi:hypothetical protein